MADAGPEQFPFMHRLYVYARLTVDREAAEREADKRRIEADPNRSPASKAAALEALREDSQKHHHALTQIEEGILRYGEALPVNEHFERVATVVEAEEAAGIDVFAQAGTELGEELARVLASWDQLKAEIATLKRVEREE